MSRLVIRKKETPKMYAYRHKDSKDIVLVKPLTCNDCPLREECKSRFLRKSESFVPFDSDMFKESVNERLHVLKNCPLEEIEVHLALNDKEA